MALHRGIQSAVFYYLSCAPCADARYRKKRKKEAEHGRAEREALYVEMPNVYRHPSPSGTNPHWATEIEAGPTLAQRGKKKNGGSGKEGGSASRKALKSSMTQRSNDSAVPSTASVDIAEGMDGRNDSKMQFRRWQREDEELWDSKTSLPIQRLRSGASSGITRPPSAHVRDPESYRRARTPAVNDLHPAVVTKVASREEAQWMMQPPPTADVMSGKERASRSRSDSGGSSRLSAKSGIPLSREVSQRLLAQKLKTGEVLPSPTLSRASTALSENAPKGQRHDRLTTDEIDFAHNAESPHKMKRMPSPIRIQVSEDSNNSATTVLRDSSQAPARPQANRAASRPQLSTINSDSIVTSSMGEDHDFQTPSSTPKDSGIALFRQSYSDNTSNSVECRDRISRRTLFLPQDDSFKALRHLAPESAIFTKHFISSEDLRRDAGARGQKFPPPRKVRLPSTDSGEEVTLAGSPELYDSWTSSDFALPDWVHEHTKREVPRQRWSMDI